MNGRVLADVVRALRPDPEVTFLAGPTGGPNSRQNCARCWISAAASAAAGLENGIGRW
jgi:hypothetical protein